jgi:hypothetical protein
MKFKSLREVIVFGLFAIMLFVRWSASAQTNAAPTTVPNYFTSVGLYLTTFNTNYTWDALNIDCETGYKQVTGVNSASFANVNYHIGNSVEIPATIQYSGVGSAINGGEIGIGYAVNHYDTRLTVDLLGGYDNFQNCGVLEPKLEVKKKLTPNTYASIGLSLPIYFEHQFNSNPTFWTGVGFTF